MVAHALLFVSTCEHVVCMCLFLQGVYVLRVTHLYYHTHNTRTCGTWCYRVTHSCIATLTRVAVEKATYCICAGNFAGGSGKLHQVSAAEYTECWVSVYVLLWCRHVFVFAFVCWKVCRCVTLCTCSCDVSGCSTRRYSRLGCRECTQPPMWRAWRCLRGCRTS